MDTAGIYFKSAIGVNPDRGAILAWSEDPASAIDSMQIQRLREPFFIGGPEGDPRGHMETPDSFSTVPERIGSNGASRMQNQGDTAASRKYDLLIVASQIPDVQPNINFRCAAADAGGVHHTIPNDLTAS